MSVVVRFPGAPVARLAARGRAQTLGSGRGALHPVRGGGVISWLRPAPCSCCGRPTLAGQAGLGGLCAQCTPPDVA